MTVSGSWNVVRGFGRGAKGWRAAADRCNAQSAYFTVDGVFLQLISVPTREFQRAGAKTTTRRTLEAHRDWDYRNMQRYMRAKSALRSEFTTLLSGTPVLYWQVTPEHMPAGNRATTYLMVTRLQAGSAIGATSVETAQVRLDRA